MNIENQMHHMNNHVITMCIAKELDYRAQASEAHKRGEGKLAMQLHSIADDFDWWMDDECDNARTGNFHATIFE